MGYRSLDTAQYYENEAMVGSAVRGLDTGLLRSWKPMPTEEVAAAMIRLAKSGKTGVHIIESQTILSV
ncbi:MAG: hypothetical protein IJ795_07665 [Bacteroidales bacterium]|nr:hypothetical protein [Bacteroidales bacterium]